MLIRSRCESGFLCLLLSFVSASVCVHSDCLFGGTMNSERDSYWPYYLTRCVLVVVIVLLLFLWFFGYPGPPEFFDSSFHSGYPRTF